MTDQTMTAWAVGVPGPIDSSPLQRIERPVPVPGPGQVRVQVRVCGVCRTDLHLAEGDLPPKHPQVIPGHEVVGIVDRLGAWQHPLRSRDRGLACPGWAAPAESADSASTAERTCALAPLFTGWDVDGGYCEYVVVDERFAYPVPDAFTDEQAAPLLCAGIIGYRALRRSQLPPGGRLGIYGFGGSAHLTAQIAMAEGARVHVMTRSPEARELALDLGATSAGGADDPPPEPLDSAILFAPVGTLVLPALEALDRGGTLAVAGIYLTDIPVLTYDAHLFEERSLCSVTANTRHDGNEFLEVAARIGVRASTMAYALDEADQALADLAGDRVNGAAVLMIAPA